MGELTTLKDLINPYLDRILNFYEYDTESDMNLLNSLRHIEIIRMQLMEKLKYCSLSEDESNLIYSVITDSYYFEKNRIESPKWKVNFIRITWNRLLSELGITVDEKKVVILPNKYVDSRNRVDGRSVYRRYKNNKRG